MISNVQPLMVRTVVIFNLLFFLARGNKETNEDMREIDLFYHRRLTLKAVDSLGSAHNVTLGVLGS